jgi:hypothetical protein
MAGNRQEQTSCKQDTAISETVPPASGLIGVNNSQNRTEKNKKKKLGKSTKTMYIQFRTNQVALLLVFLSRLAYWRSRLISSVIPFLVECAFRALAHAFKKD